PRTSIVSSTFFLVEGLTFGLPFTTLETVAIDTFASRATSYIVTVISLPPDASIVLFVHHFTISQGLRLKKRKQRPIILDWPLFTLYSYILLCMYIREFIQF